MKNTSPLFDINQKELALRRRVNEAHRRAEAQIEAARQSAREQVRLPPEFANQPLEQALSQIRQRLRVIPEQLAQIKAQQKSLARTDPGSSLEQLELALNQAHYDSLGDALAAGNGNRALLRDYFQTEVDLINIAIALRLAPIPGVAALVGQRYNAADARPLFIEAQRCLAPEQLANLIGAGNGIEGVVLGLSHTRYGPALQTGRQRYQADEGGLPVLTRELERWRAGQIAAMFSRHPLSIAIPIGYIGCKELEVSNVRLIAQTVQQNLPRQQAQRDLIMV